MFKKKKIIAIFSAFALGGTTLIVPSILQSISLKNDSINSLNNNKRAISYEPTSIKNTILTTSSFDASIFNLIDKTIDWTDNNSVATSIAQLLINDNWRNLFWDNLPYLTSDEISVTIDSYNKNNGSIIVSGITLKYYFTSDGESTSEKQFIPAGKKINIIGLARTNTLLNSNLTVSEGKNVSWNASSIFNYAELDVTKFNTQLIVEQSNIIPNQIFINLPLEFNKNTDFQLSSPVQNFFEGSITYTARVKNININSTLVTDFQEFKLTFTGFKKILTWNEKLKIPGQNTYEYQIPNDDQLQKDIFVFASGDPDAKNNIIKKYIQDHAFQLLSSPNIDENDEISININSIDKVNRSIVFTAIIDGNTLNQMTFSNLLSLPIIDIKAKKQVNINSFAAEFAWSIVNKVNDQGVVEKLSSREINNNLLKIYDGFDPSVDYNSIYDFSISPITYNETGAIYLNLSFIDKATKFSYTIETKEPFIANKKGITSLNSNFILDTSSKTINDLFSELQNAQSFDLYIKNNSSIINTYSDFDSRHITFSQKNIQIISNSQISADLYMKEAVDATQYFNYANDTEPMFLGRIVISKNTNAATTIIKNYAYTREQKYQNNEILTPSDFQNWISSNKKDQNFLKKFITVSNAPANYVISLDDKSYPIIKDNTITYNFIVSNAYDENGALIDSCSQLITFNLLYANKLATSITENMQLSDSKYAFEYTPDQLAQLPGLIVNPVVGFETPRVEIIKVDNFNRTITANVILDKYQNHDSSNNNHLEKIVKFYGAKKVSSPTAIIRNTTPISEKESDFKKAADSQDIAQQTSLISKYISFAGTTTNNSQYRTQWSIDPKHKLTQVTGNGVSGQPLKGVFEVGILMKNYFVDDDLLTFNKDIQTNPTIIRFYTSANEPTQLTPTAAAGINATAPLSLEIPSDLDGSLNDSEKGILIRQWVIDNFNNIFMYYPAEVIPSINNFVLTNVKKIDETSIEISFTLNGAIEDSGQIGKFSSKFIIKNLTAEQTISSLKDNVEITALTGSNKIPGIDASTYAIDIASNPSEFPETTSIKNQIINSINEHPELYYQGDTVPSVAEMNGRSIVDPTFTSSFVTNSDSSLISLRLKYLQRQNNPNKEAQYVEGSIDFTTFNTKLTNNTLTPISVSSTPLSNLLPSEVKIDNRDLLDFVHHESTLNAAFSNISKRFIYTNSSLAKLKVTKLVPNNAERSLDVYVEAMDSYVGLDAPNIKGYGSLGDQVIKLTGFAEEQLKTTPKESIQINDLNISGINSDYYTIDIATSLNEGSSELQQKIKDAINNVSNLDKFFDNAPNEEQIANRPIIQPNSTFNFDYADGKLMVNGYFLSRQENPYINAKYEKMTIKINGFNTNITQTKNQDGTYQIDASDPILNKLPTQITASDLSAFINQPGMLNKIFKNIPESTKLGNVKINVTDNSEGTINATITLNHAKINPTVINKGFGVAQINVIFKTFTIEQKQILGKTLSVRQAAQAGLIGIEKPIYSIDFEDMFISKLQNAFMNNMSSWFDNIVHYDASGNPTTNILSKLDGKDFMIGKPTISYFKNYVKIIGNFYGWNSDGNPNSPLEPTECVITINDFNTQITDKNGDVIDISSISELNNIFTDDKTLKSKLESFLNTDQGKELVLVNYPNKISINNVEIVSYDKNLGTVHTIVSLQNAFTGQGTTGYGQKSIEITFTGFKQFTNLTSGKTINVVDAAENGLVNNNDVSINSNDYAFDFENEFMDSFKEQINDKENMPKWFDNAPSADKIGSQSIIDPSNINLVIKYGLVNGVIQVSITGSFISYNTDNNKNSPLIYREQTITIIGFNKINSVVIGNLDLRDSGMIPGVDIDSTKYSTQKILDLLNQNKNTTVKTVLKQWAASRTIESCVQGITNSFNTTLNKSIDDGNFEFKLSGDRIQITFHDIDQAINNGLSHISKDLTIGFLNRFNPIDMQTRLINSVINYSNPLFKAIFKKNSEITTFAYDWKWMIQNNRISEIRDSLKNYMKMNVSSFFKNNKNEDLINNVVVNDVTINNELTENKEFLSNVSTNKFTFSISFLGYTNGTLQQMNANLSFILKANPSEDQIIKNIQDILSQQYDSKWFINKDTYEDVINQNGYDIRNKIHNALLSNSELLPKHIDINIPENLSDLFELGSDGKSIVLKKDSITITGQLSGNLSLNYNIPNESNQIKIKTLLPSSQWNDWVVYLIFALMIVAFIVIIVLYEVLSARIRRKTSERVG